MANNSNLVSGRFSELDTDRHKEISKKGGLKSGQARNRSKSIKNQLEKMLKIQIDCSSMSFTRLMESSNIKLSISEALAMALLYKGITTGDARTIEFIMKVNGEIVGKDVTDITSNRASTYEEALRICLGEEM